MAIYIQACATTGESVETTLATVWDQPGTVFLCSGAVYVVPATMVSGGGYITVTRVSDGANHDLQSNAAVKVAQSAVLTATF